MRIKLLLPLVPLMLSQQVDAATKQEVWEPLAKQFQHYQVNNPQTIAPLVAKGTFADKSDYQLSFIRQTEAVKIKHYRYQMKYKDIPIWGYHTMIHHYPNHKNMVTGFVIDGIDKDIPSTVGRLSIEEVWHQLIKKAKLSGDEKAQQRETIIFIDKHHKAHLAYKISYFTRADGTFRQPSYVIDANSGEQLKVWDNLKRSRVGTGVGGATNAANPVGPFNYQTTPVGNNFPRFNVFVDGATCRMRSNYLQVRMYDANPGSKSFPILMKDEGVGGNPGVFAFACNNNANDGGTAPVNDGQSPNNDAMFFAQTTLDMLRTIYGFGAPIGKDLPIRIYTHLKREDNAFYIPTIYSNGLKISRQQIGLGNGRTQFVPLTQGVTTHELAHGITENYSQLIYANESGGMNESFSDVIVIALYQDLTDLGFGWYWNSINRAYNIGQFAMANGQPLRYMNNPALDGVSINSADDYVDGMDVHFSSGVFNRAYYLISTRYNWGPIEAFRLYLFANRDFWPPASTFAYGACGLIQEAYDRGLAYRQIINAFNTVGVKCKLFKPDNQVM